VESAGVVAVTLLIMDDDYESVLLIVRECYGEEWRLSVAQDIGISD
jgi:hypothetical protein